MKLQTIKKYTAFFGAIFSYTSILFFMHAYEMAVTNRSSVTSAYGYWFLLGATACWVIYLLGYVLIAIRTKNTK
jgi:hypothetical protein